MNAQNSIVGVVDQFTHLVDLNEKEMEFLVSLQRESKRYASGEILRESGSPAVSFYILRSGWAYATRVLSDGQRQVLDIFLPGQIIGLGDLGYARSPSDVVALTELEVCPFPRNRVTEVFAESPRLTDMLFSIMAREQAMLTERVVNIGRRTAAQRLAHFILEMKVRLNQSGNVFPLPLNQTFIGDALGLTAVHISRTLKELRCKNLVSFSEGVVTIQNLDRLVEFAEFNRTYLEGRASWLH